MGLFTMKQSTLAYRVDFALYGASVATLGAVLLIFSPRSDWLANALWSFSGLMSWSAIEYLLHRFVLHGVQPFRRWHAEHHLHPAALICSPTILSASLIFALVSLPALLTAGPWRACAVTFGILVGYFSYAVTHHATHHWRPATAWLRERKQWHALHHHDSAHPSCFGVSSGLWDRLLGTTSVKSMEAKATERAAAQTSSSIAPTLRPHLTNREHIMKTDSQLQKDVMAELNWEPSVHATHIGVEVKDGVVTLAGNVGTYTEKWNAERASQRVAGVKAIAVELKVKLAGSGVRTDADIAESARNVLEWTSAVQSDAVKVMVEKGWITLTGEVGWKFQKEAAADAVRFLSGVVGVIDEMTITPSVKAAVVKGDIEAAIKRAATEDAKKITVGVSGSDVTLSGSIQSWAERDLATQSAWNSPGVSKVIDKMTLSY